MTAISTGPSAAGAAGAAVASTTTVSLTVSLTTWVTTFSTSLVTTFSTTFSTTWGVGAGPLQAARPSMAKTTNTTVTTCNFFILSSFWIFPSPYELALASPRLADTRVMPALSQLAALELVKRYGPDDHETDNDLLHEVV